MTASNVPLNTRVGEGRGERRERGRERMRSNDKEKQGRMLTVTQGRANGCSLFPFYFLNFSVILK